MIILGIDPGTATTGFGAIEKKGNKLSIIDAGIISTSPKLDMSQRLIIIYQEVKTIIKQLHPDEVAIELLYFANNVTTAFSVGQARGIVVLASAQAKIPISEYTPLQVKMAVSGYGKAKKNQIQLMVKKILDLKNIPKPDDAADALAIAITHAQSLNQRQ